MRTFLGGQVILKPFNVIVAVAKVSLSRDRGFIAAFIPVLTSAMTLPAVLTIAGSDPSGGAGIQVSPGFAEHF